MGDSVLQFACFPPLTTLRSGPLCGSHVRALWTRTRSQHCLLDVCLLGSTLPRLVHPVPWLDWPLYSRLVDPLYSSLLVGEPLCSGGGCVASIL